MEQKFLQLRNEIEKIQKQNVRRQKPNHKPFYDYGKFAGNSSMNQKEFLETIVKSLSFSISEGYDTWDVMWIQPDDYKRPENTAKYVCRPEWLCGFASKVYNILCDYELRPEVMRLADDTAFLMVVRAAK